MSQRPDEPGHISSSRRTFLSVAAGTVAAAAIGSRVAARPLVQPSAQAGKPLPKAKPRTPLNEGETIRMGVIGTGGMGTGHCDAFMTLAKNGREKVQIVAVCDVCDSHLERAYRKCAEGQEIEVSRHRDYHELLAREDIHGVLIASPEHWHAQMAIDALLAGKDVYLEKPMTLNLDDALRLREVVLANPDLRLQVGTQMTNMPKFHEAKKVIERGDIGPATFSQTSYCRNSTSGEWNYYRIDPNWKPGVNVDWDAWLGHMGPREWDPKVFARWRRYKDFSTGIIGDLLVHVMTPMLVALGDQVGWPTRVVAVGSHLVDKEMENFDQVNLAINFESGHQMVVAGSTCNEVGLETLIRGHKGNIYLGGRHCVVRPERIYSEEMDTQEIECPDIGNDQDMHRLKWLKCIRTREQPDSDIVQGTKVMVIVDLAARSMWEGAAFGFDPKTMTARKL